MTHKGWLILVVGFVCSACALQSRQFEQAPDDAAWRCSFDRKVYQIQTSGEFLRIQPVRSGVFSAALRIKTDKKGHRKIMGQWQSGALTGFILIADTTDQTVSGYMLVPGKGVAPNTCVSRTAAVLSSLADTTGQGLSCFRVEVKWQRESDLTLAQAATQEVESENAQAYLQASQAPVDGAQSAGGNAQGSPLVGTWVFQDAGSVHYTNIEITLRADGTYSKSLRSRTPGWGGGGVVGPSGLGGTSTGTWTARGMVVHLSGDGNWPPSDHNLGGFQKVR